MYFIDTGLCCFLLGISKPEQLVQYPKLGALFETLVFGQIYRKAALHGHSERLYFYRDAQGRKVDFVIEQAGRFRLVEVKWSREPQQVSAGFDAFTKLVGADAISERRFVTRERTMIPYPGANVGRPSDLVEAALTALRRPQLLILGPLASVQCDAVRPLRPRSSGARA